MEKHDEKFKKAEELNQEQFFLPCTTLLLVRISSLDCLKPSFGKVLEATMLEENLMGKYANRRSVHRT